MAYKPAARNWTLLRDRWLLVALAAPLAVAPWGYDTTELPKLTFLRIIALGLMLTGLFTRSRSAWASADEAKVSSIHPLRLPIMAFLVALGASAVRSYDPWSSLAAYVDCAMLAFFAFSFTGAARDASFQERALGMSVWVGGMGASWALAQCLVHDPLNGAAVRRAGGSPCGPLADPAVLASYLSVAFPLALWQMVHGARAAGRLAGSACAVLIGAALLAGHRGGACIGAGAGAILMLSLLRLIGRPRRRALWAAAVLAAVVVAGAALPGAPAGRSPAETAALRDAALRMVRAQPVLGWGPGAFGLTAPGFVSAESAPPSEPNRPLAVDTANAYLDVLIAGGVLSIGAFIWILGAVAARLTGRLAAAMRRDGPDLDRLEDAAFAAAWAGLLVAWLIQGWGTPGSIALHLPFWSAVGLASTPAVPGGAAIACRAWPKVLRWAGAAAAIFLLTPVPQIDSFRLVQGRWPSPSMATNGFVPGSGAVLRWMVGDLYYARAMRARSARNWDDALDAHLASLSWAPSRVGNWLGFGETALDAFKGCKRRPFDWVQYGKIGYYRAQRMQPINGYAYYGEARLLTEAAKRGMPATADARRDYERAIRLYPHVGPFHAGLADLYRTMGLNDLAQAESRTAARLSGDGASAYP